jgi:hypothetical protein
MANAVPMDFDSRPVVYISMGMVFVSLFVGFLVDGKYHTEVKRMLATTIILLAGTIMDLLSVIWMLYMIGILCFSSQQRVHPLS